VQREADQDLPGGPQPDRIQGESWTCGIKPVQVFIRTPNPHKWVNSRSAPTRQTVCMKHTEPNVKRDARLQASADLWAVSLRFLPLATRTVLTLRRASIQFFTLLARRRRLRLPSQALCRNRLSIVCGGRFVGIFSQLLQASGDGIGDTTGSHSSVTVAAVEPDQMHEPERNSMHRSCWPQPPRSGRLVCHDC
ncbi:hypothetical protein RCH10_005421, partial [Variovorax sp. GrIS 2.14]